MTIDLRMSRYHKIIISCMSLLFGSDSIYILKMYLKYILKKCYLHKWANSSSFFYRKKSERSDSFGKYRSFRMHKYRQMIDLNYDTIAYSNQNVKIYVEIDWFSFSVKIKYNSYSLVIWCDL